MRIPKYNFIEENVRIWREYDSRKLGLRYCFQSDRGTYMPCTDIDSLIDVLRDFRVYPDQIENHFNLLGIEKELPNMQYQRVIRGLSRPKIFVTKLQRFNGEAIRPDEDWRDIDLNRRFGLNIDKTSRTEVYPLNNLIKELNWYGARANDLVLREATEFEYVNLDEKYKYYILSSLDRIK